MLRITWDTNGEVVFKVSGRLDAENVGDLKALFSSEANGRRYLQVLDAQRNLFRSELDLTMLQRQELTSIIELYRALGGG